METNHVESGSPRRRRCLRLLDNFHRPPNHSPAKTQGIPPPPPPPQPPPPPPTPPPPPPPKLRDEVLTRAALQLGLAFAFRGSERRAKGSRCRRLHVGGSPFPCETAAFAWFFWKATIRGTNAKKDEPPTWGLRLCESLLWFKGQKRSRCFDTYCKKTPPNKGAPERNGHGFELGVLGLAKTGSPFFVELRVSPTRSPDFGGPVSRRKQRPRQVQIREKHSS